MGRDGSGKENDELQSTAQLRHEMPGGYDLECDLTTWTLILPVRRNPSVSGLGHDARCQGLSCWDPPCGSRHLRREWNPHGEPGGWMRLRWAGTGLSRHSLLMRAACSLFVCYFRVTSPQSIGRYHCLGIDLSWARRNAEEIKDTCVGVMLQFADKMWAESVSRKRRFRRDIDQTRTER